MGTLWPGVRLLGRLVTTDRTAVGRVREYLVERLE